MGPSSKDQKEGRVLNRVLRWTEKGICYEADPRQHEKLVQELGVETLKDSSAVKALSTPCVRHTRATGHRQEDRAT